MGLMFFCSLNMDVWCRLPSTLSSEAFFEISESRFSFEVVLGVMSDRREILKSLFLIVVLTDIDRPEYELIVSTMFWG